MCSLCGDPGHNDMRCPCFGYSGEEYVPPVETDRTTTPRIRRPVPREFSGPRVAFAAPPEHPPRHSR